MEQQLANTATGSAGIVTEPGNQANGEDGYRGYRPIQFNDQTPPVPDTTDLRVLNQSILQNQQQMTAQIAACMQNAGEAQRALNILNERKDAMEREAKELSKRISEIDGSSERGRDRREQLRDERNEVLDQKSRVTKALTEVRTNYNRSKNACKARVNELKTRKRDAEKRMLYIFNESIKVRNV